jgi:hypothetical protein
MHNAQRLVAFSATATLVAAILASCQQTSDPVDSPAFVAAGAVTGVGELGEGFESDIVGPSAFYVGDKGELLVLDRVNRKLVISAPNGQRLDYLLANLFDEPVIDPLDLSIIDDRIFVMDVDGAKLSRVTYSSLVSPQSAADESSGATAPADWDEARRQFGISAFTTAAAGAEESSGALESCEATGWDENQNRSWSESRRRPESAAIFEVTFSRPRADRLSLSLSVDGGRALRMTPLSSTGFIGAATLAGVDRDGRVYVLLEHLETGARLAVTPVVYRFENDGKLTAKFDVPVGGARQLPLRYVTVTAGGAVHHAQIVSGQEMRAARLVESRIEDPIQLRLMLASAELAPFDPFRPLGPFESSGDDLPTTTRSDVMRRAEAMAAVEWEITPSAYGPPEGESDICRKEAGAMWLRPAALQGGRGQTRRGLPYKWSGWDSAESFRSKPSAAGGDVCTCRNSALGYCVTPGSRGIDCSGFITRAWFEEPRTKYGTWTLAEISDAIEVRELKCGDILNKAGNHVVLFAGFSEKMGGAPEIYESSIHCSGVCRRVVPYALLAGYEARKYKEIE